MVDETVNWAYLTWARKYKPSEAKMLDVPIDLAHGGFKLGYKKPTQPKLSSHNFIFIFIN